MKNFTIGVKMTKKKIISRIAITLILFIFCYYLIWNSIVGMIFRVISGNGLLLYILLTFPVLLVILYAYLTDIIIEQYIEVTEDYLIFNEVANRKEAMTELKALFTNEVYRPSFYVKLSDIVCVQLGCHKINKGFRGIHPLVLLDIKCLLRDGTRFKIIPSCLISKEGDYEKLLHLLENEGIYISDPYEIRPALAKDNVYFQEYVLNNDKGEWFYEK